MSAGASSTVEVVIAVHSAARPVRRAVDSVLRDPVGADVVVVAHNLDPAALDPQLGDLVPADAARVRVVPLADGVHSPAGPFNAGIAQVRSEWFAIMGSDDWLEEGALSEWFAATGSSGAGAAPDVVLAPLRHQSGEDVPTPLPRPGRTTALDAVRDRLFYRTAPLGLIRTATWRTTGAELDGRVRTGEDIEASARLWSSGARVDYARHAPRYVIGADATDRITTAPAPAADVLAAVVLTARARWACERPAPVRRSLAVKLARTHVLGLVTSRDTRGAALTEDDARALHEAMAAVHALSDAWRGAFTRADRWVLEACVRAGTTAAQIQAAARRRAAAAPWTRNVPSPVWHLLDRESTLVRYAVTALDARAVRRGAGARRTPPDHRSPDHRSPDPRPTDPRPTDGAAA